MKFGKEKEQRPAEQDLADSTRHADRLLMVLDRVREEMPAQMAADLVVTKQTPNGRDMIITTNIGVQANEMGEGVCIAVHPNGKAELYGDRDAFTPKRKHDTLSIWADTTAGIRTAKDFFNRYAAKNGVIPVAVQAARHKRGMGL